MHTISPHDNFCVALAITAVHRHILAPKLNLRHTRYRLKEDRLASLFPKGKVVVLYRSAVDYGPPVTAYRNLMSRGYVLLSRAKTAKPWQERTIFYPWQRCSRDRGYHRSVSIPHGHTSTSCSWDPGANSARNARNRRKCRARV